MGQSGMARRHVITTLERHYARLIGRQIKCATPSIADDITHVMAVLRMFDPDWDGADVKPIAPRGPSRWRRKGEGTRAAIEAVRRADCALSATEIARESYLVRDMTPPPNDELRLVGTDLIYSLRRLLGERLVATGKRPVRYRLMQPAANSPSTGGLRAMPSQRDRPL